MKSRMEKYYTNDDILERTTKNNKLYEENDTITPSSKVSLVDNVSEIDVSKIKELLDSREGYKRVKNYQGIINSEEENEEEENNEYDIYEDIENKIYDINSILEQARSRRNVNEEREQRRKLKTTQYNILSKLDLNAKEESKEEDDSEEMDSNFFSTDKDLTKLVNETSKEEKEEQKEETSNDLFANLKGNNENTILTEPIKEENEVPVNNIKVENETKESNTFYTNVLSFTKEDFEEISSLKSTVKTNTKLIKILIFVLLVTMITIISLIVVNFVR